MLLNQVLPASEDAYFQARFMAASGQPAAALAIWQRLLSLGKPVELRRSIPFIEFLIQSDRAEDTSRVWREALAAAGLPHSEPTNQSLIWNGDFARDFLNGGLDWRWNSPFGLRSVSMRRLLRPGADHCDSISAGVQIWISASPSSSFRSSPATVTIFTWRCVRKESRPRTDFSFQLVTRITAPPSCPLKISPVRTLGPQRT